MTHNTPKEQHEAGSSDLANSAAAIVSGIAALVAAVGSIIAFVTGGRLAFRLALSLIFIGVAVGLGVLTVKFRQSEKFREFARRRGTIVAGLLSVAAVAAGLSLARTESPSPPPPSCRTPAHISGADTSAASFTIGVNLRCRAPSGNYLRLVEQLLNEGVKGTVKHSEYYLGWDVKNSVGQSTYSDHPGGCTTRRYYLISVTPDELQLIQQSPRTKSGSYYGEPVDTIIEQYIVSNVQVNHTCNSP